MDAALLSDLRAEYDALDAVVEQLRDDEWDTPTPAVGWTVADQVAHLTWSERAASLALDGRSSDVFGAPSRVPPVDDRSPTELLAAWRTSRGATLDRFARRDDRSQVVWGAGPMSAWSFAQSRLMETWAHGLDILDALEYAQVDTDRLHHVAGLAFRALPYAFRVAREEPPGNLRDLALVLTAPSRDVWRFGRSDAPERIEGSAGDWCRVATKRLRAEATTLSTNGPLSAAALRVARAYLDDRT